MSLAHDLTGICGTHSVQFVQYLEVEVWMKRTTQLQGLRLRRFENLLDRWRDREQSQAGLNFARLLILFSRRALALRRRRDERVHFP